MRHGSMVLMEAEFERGSRASTPGTRQRGRLRIGTDGLLGGGWKNGMPAGGAGDLRSGTRRGRATHAERGPSEACVGRARLLRSGKRRARNDTCRSAPACSPTQPTRSESEVGSRLHGTCVPGKDRAGLEPTTKRIGARSLGPRSCIVWKSRCQARGRLGESLKRGDHDTDNGCQHAESLKPGDLVT